MRRTAQQLEAGTVSIYSLVSAVPGSHKQEKVVQDCLGKATNISLMGSVDVDFEKGAVTWLGSSSVMGVPAPSVAGIMAFEERGHLASLRYMSKAHGCQSHCPSASG